MSKRAEQAAIRIHHTAILEAEKYSKEHGCSIVEEVVYGRGFKAGYIKGDTDGYEQAEKDILPAAQALVDAVERYVKQGCLRSELLIKKDKLKKLL